MVKLQKTSCNFGAIPRSAADRQNFTKLGAFELIWAFYSGRPGESKVIYCRLGPPKA
jgi:hypothetical protein